MPQMKMHVFEVLLIYAVTLASQNFSANDSSEYELREEQRQKECCGCEDEGKLLREMQGHHQLLTGCSLHGVHMVCRKGCSAFSPPGYLRNAIWATNQAVKYFSSFLGQSFMQIN